jgi:hypothetical protein
MVPALQHEEIVTDVLPNLQNVCLEESSKTDEAVEQVLSSQGIGIYNWDGERCMWWIVK